MLCTTIVACHIQRDAFEQGKWHVFFCACDWAYVHCIVTCCYFEHSLNARLQSFPLLFPFELEDCAVLSCNTTASHSVSLNGARTLSLTPWEDLSVCCTSHPFRRLLCILAGQMLCAHPWSVHNDALEVWAHMLKSGCFMWVTSYLRAIDVEACSALYSMQNLGHQMLLRAESTSHCGACKVLFHTPFQVIKDQARSHMLMHCLSFQRKHHSMWHIHNAPAGGAIVLVCTSAVHLPSDKAVKHSPATKMLF